jgi:hypothetical protein
VINWWRYDGLVECLFPCLIVGLWNMVHHKLTFPAPLDDHVHTILTAQVGLSQATDAYFAFLCKTLKC